MDEELPELLRESRQRQSYAQEKLSPTDMKELILRDIGDAKLADQIENEMLMRETTSPQR